MVFDHDPDLARAMSPPPRIYVDPEVWAIERRRVFRRTWQLAAHIDQLARRGDFLCAEVAGEPIVLVRDGELLRGFHNVCRHRAGPVAAGCGRRQTLQCAYHGWTYGLDGRLRSAPEMPELCDLADDIRLAPVQVEAWGPLVFVNVDAGSADLASMLDDIPGRTAGLGIDGMRHVARREYVVDCNWKVYVDNYLEGYHIPIVHPALMKELDYASYRVETGKTWTVQHAPLRSDKPDGEDRHYDPSHRDDHARYVWLFPNMMLNLYQGQLQTNVVVPVAVDRSVIVFDWFAPEPDAVATDHWSRLVAFSDAIQDEDRRICEAVQRNLHSVAAARGRYCARRENGVHHFHGMLSQWLAQSDPPPR